METRDFAWFHEKTLHLSYKYKIDKDDIFFNVILSRQNKSKLSAGVLFLSAKKHNGAEREKQR